MTTFIVCGQVLAQRSKGKVPSSVCKNKASFIRMDGRQCCGKHKSAKFVRSQCLYSASDDDEKLKKIMSGLIKDLINHWDLKLSLIDEVVSNKSLSLRDKIDEFQDTWNSLYD